MSPRRDEMPARRLVPLSLAVLLAALSLTPAAPLSAAPAPAPAPLPAPPPAASSTQPWQVVPSSGGLSRPLMPDSRLDPPSNVTPILFAYAQGVQRYVCAPREKAPGGAAAAPSGAAGAAGTPAAPAINGYAWTLKEPQAKLFDGADHEIGEHSAGPTWQLKDGSKVVKKKVVATVPALESDGVPWLLVEVEPSGKGGLAGVQYVQRVDTVGGAAPPTGCTAANAKTTLDVEYRATYVFYAPPAGR